MLWKYVDFDFKHAWNGSAEWDDQSDPSSLSWQPFLTVSWSCSWRGLHQDLLVVLCYQEGRKHSPGGGKEEKQDDATFPRRRGGERMSGFIGISEWDAGERQSKFPIQEQRATLCYASCVKHTTLLLALPAVEIWQIIKPHVDCADMKG